MSLLPLFCPVCGKHTTTAGTCIDCLNTKTKGIKMKFTEWFDTENDVHMKLVEYFFTHGNWPFNTQLEALDQSDRYLWSIILNAILAKKYVDNWKKQSKY